jgi:hypothetical protein
VAAPLARARQNQNKIVVARETQEHDKEGKDKVSFKTHQQKQLHRERNMNPGNMCANESIAFSYQDMLVILNKTLIPTLG